MEAGEPVGRNWAGGTRRTRGSPRDPGIGDAWIRWAQEVSAELLLPWAAVGPPLARRSQALEVLSASGPVALLLSDPHLDT